ncbi:spore germination protein [Scopulibacillus cellulosilyticus]|uniref:Spore germination protein n=1 Tax=Scopulibacillus cellulosilyticus TaxID=2665665 RepID=A0ABW2PQT2_9BACL
MVEFSNGVKIHRNMKKKKITQEYERIKINEIKESVDKDLEKNLSLIEQITGKSSDVIIRRFTIGKQSAHKAAIVYIQGLVNDETINNFILKSTMIETRKVDLPESENMADFLNVLKKHDLNVGEINEDKKFKTLMHSVLSGQTAIFVEGQNYALMMDTRMWQMRAIESPENETTIRGPREGFIETLVVNTSLIRRRLRDPDLRIRFHQLGERTQTDIAVVYIEGIANEEILEEINHRIDEIKTDGILESGYIEQFIEDSTWSPFPQIQSTERPDKTIGHLLEGKAIILTDGSPFALIAPTIFASFFQTPEDYYERVWITSFLRFIRLISVFFSLFAPSLYIAFSTFHPEMIPPNLLYAMAAGRSAVPFPTIIEAMIMEITIEILREASIRLPGKVGSTIGIVGALVVGEASVTAGLVSPLMVIVVSITAICSFTSPSYGGAIAIRLIRFPMMLIAAFLGLYGIMLFTLLIILHLSSLKSFGVPYFAPFSPLHLSGLKDVIFRAPLTWMVKRPIFMKPLDKHRDQKDVKTNDKSKSESKSNQSSNTKSKTKK